MYMRKERDFFIPRAALSILFGRRALTRVFCDSSEEKKNKNKNLLTGCCQPKKGHQFMHVRGNKKRMKITV